MSNTLYVGTEDGLHTLNGDAAVPIEGRKVSHVTRADDGWYALVDRSEVWRSTDGSDWSALATVENRTLNCVISVGRDVYVGTSNAHLYKMHDGGFQQVETFDGTEGHETWHTPWGGPPDVRSMSAHPSGTVFANVHVGGIPRSSDGGATWEPTVPVESDVHEVFCDPDSGMVLAAAAIGLGVSDDGGATWRWDSDGVHGRYIRAAAVAGDTVLASASTGPYTDRGAVYRKALWRLGPVPEVRAGATRVVLRQRRLHVSGGQRLLRRLRNLRRPGVHLRRRRRVVDLGSGGAGGGSLRHHRLTSAVRQLGRSLSLPEERK